MTKPRRSLESAGISDAQYLQIMERVAEQNYKDWGLPSSDAALIQALNDNTYDYRGYYNKYPNSRANASTHWTDEFKTVYHPTFSRESKYSGKKSQYNPKGLTGGTWYGETFIPSVDLLVERNKFENGGNKDNGTYDIVSDVLDFVPVVGGLNRFARGEYTEGLINLGLDALGPLKYVAKGVKGIRTLANMGKFAKRQKQFTRYQKTIDKVAARAENLSKQGKDYSKEVDTIKRLSEKANKVGEKANRYKKAIKDNAISVGGKVVDDLSYTPKIAIASAARTAGVNNDNDADALKALVVNTVKDYSYNPQTVDPGDGFLLTDSQQKKFMEKLGYFKTDDEDGIKKIKKATDALTRFRLGRKPNIYQLGEDEISRDSVIPIEEREVPDSLLNGFSRARYLNHSGDNPTIYYKHKNPNKKEYYYREIDLNDYGKHIEQQGTEYGPIQYLANLYDFVGNPFIQKTGITRMDSKYKYPDIETNNNSKYRDGGSIHIAPSKRGTFTAAATKHGMGVQEFASRVLRNKEDFSTAMVKKANFARNASKWKH